MTTSGSVAFNLNRDQIIRPALRKLGAISAGEIPDNQTVQDCAMQLNALVKAWMAIGIHLWTESEAVLFVEIGQPVYTLGPGSGDHSTEIYTQTELDADAALNATSIVVLSNTSVANGIDIGVTTDDGNIFWTTVASFSGTTITLTDALDDSASSGAAVYIASPNIDRPLRIPGARRWDEISNIETPLIPLSRQDYRNLPNKLQTGMVTQYFYDPRGGANVTGQLYLWPTPVNTTNNNIKFTYYRPLQTFDTAANTPDFPQEWLDTLIWNLAKKMAPEYDCPPQRYQMVIQEAAQSLDLVQGWDREPESIYFGVNFDMR